MAFLNHLIQLQRKRNVLCIHMQSFLIRGVACSVMGPIICGQTVILISFRSTGLRSCVITCHTSFVDCKNATRLFPGHNLVAISFRSIATYNSATSHLIYLFSQGLEYILEDTFYVKYSRRLTELIPFGVFQLLCHCPVLRLLKPISGVTTRCKSVSPDLYQDLKIM